MQPDIAYISSVWARYVIRSS